MNKDELKEYQNLSKFQKELLSALKEMGFKHKRFTTYEKSCFGSIKVGSIRNIEELFKKVYQKGKDDKRHEFLNALGI